MINKLKTTSLLLILTALVGCGGGSGGTEDSDANKVKTLRIATFGDSTANVSPLEHDVQVFKADLDGANFEQSIDARKYLIPFYYPAAYLVGNGGFSGDTTTKMLARDGLPASTTRKASEDIIALNPQVILFRGGSINDLQNISAADRATRVETTYNNHIRLIEKFTTANIPVLDAGIFGYLSSQVEGFGETDPDQIRLALTALNAKFKAYAGEQEKVTFVDSVGVVSDASGKYMPEMTYDGVHLSLQGSLAVAKKEADTLAKLFGGSASASFEADGKNLFPTISDTEKTLDPNFVVWGEDASKRRIQTVAGKTYQFADFERSDADEDAQGGGFNIKLASLINTLEKGKTYGISLDIILENSSGAGEIKLSTRLDLKNDNNGSYRLTTFTNGNNDTLIDFGKLSGRIELPPLLLDSALNDESQFIVHLSKLPLNSTVSIGISALSVVELPAQ